MQKIIQKISIILILILSIIQPIEAKTLTIGELIEKAPQYDKKVITLEAEAIGEMLERGDKAWVNINDGTGAVGVYIDKKEAEKIKTWGNYHSIGDTVKVTGVFYRAYNAQGGDLAIEGNSIERIKEGEQKHYTVDKGKYRALYFLVPIACVLGAIKFKKVKKIHV